jgi:Putative MetA-pathway of phenol degradation
MGRVLMGLALVAVLGSIAGARADDDGALASADPFYRLDTKNLFGALEGADVGDIGDRSIELENTPSLFKPSGRYVFDEQEAIYEMTLTPRLGVEFGAHFLGQSIHGAPGVSNYSGVDFSGLSNEWRYVLTPRSGPWSVQTTFTVEPQWARVFEGGARGQDYSLPFLFVLDAQPIARRLYAALNLSYDPEIQRLDGAAWTQASALTASAALSWRFTPAAMIGLEADAYNQFDGLAAQSWRGSAFFLGPTFHYQITEKVDLSGAWTQQLLGCARGERGPLDLADFTRSEAKLRLEMEF